MVKIVLLGAFEGSAKYLVIAGIQPERATRVYAPSIAPRPLGQPSLFWKASSINFQSNRLKSCSSCFLPILSSQAIKNLDLNWNPLFPPSLKNTVWVRNYLKIRRSNKGTRDQKGDLEKKSKKFFFLKCNPFKMTSDWNGAWSFDPAASHRRQRSLLLEQNIEWGSWIMKFYQSGRQYFFCIQ